MFGLEIGTDVSGLEGCELEQVAVGEHQVQLHLSNRASLSIEGSFSMTPAGAVPTTYSRPADAAQVLADRLGREVLRPGRPRLRLGSGRDSALSHPSEATAGFFVFAFFSFFCCCPVFDDVPGSGSAESQERGASSVSRLAPRIVSRNGTMTRPFVRRVLVRPAMVCLSS